MGKMFTTKKRVRPVFVEDTDKTMFAEVCPAYGLPADFYEMGAMDELGFYYVLKSLKNGMAEFSDLNNYTFSVPFEDGVNMMIREALQEIHELADKAEMLGIEDIRSSAAVNEARRDIRARIATLNESKKVANTDMMTVLKDMKPLCQRKPMRLCC